MQWVIDQEVQRIVEDARAKATELLPGHRQQLDSLAKALLKGETLGAPDAYAAASVPLEGAGPTEGSLTGAARPA
jgi:ATP-dependent Zn protease